MADQKIDAIRDLMRQNVQEEGDRAMRIVFVGHVDHGKSTLVGRLLHETDSVLPSKMQYVEDICRDRGMKFEYAFLLDALEEEQDQGVTIDVSEVIFKTRKRPYRVIDAPGHKEFLKNMISGASSAEVAVLLIDAEEGLREQSKRHATILSLLGIQSVIVAINKMDLVGYKKEVFESIKTEYSAYLDTLKIKPFAYIPISAYVGDNLVSKTSQMNWYKGPTFLELLDGLEHRRTSVHKPFRLPLQDVFKFDRRRILAGKIESGKVAKGDGVLFLPSGKSGVIKSIEKWSTPGQDTAMAGESVGIVLEDQIFVERGEVACHKNHPPMVQESFSANLFWMGKKHLQTGKSYLVKLTTQDVPCTVARIQRVINSSTLEEVSDKHEEVARNEVAEVVLQFKKPIVFDHFKDIEQTGRFVLVDGRVVSGGGIILKK